MVGRWRISGEEKRTRRFRRKSFLLEMLARSFVRVPSYFVHICFLLLYGRYIGRHVRTSTVCTNRVNMYDDNDDEDEDDDAYIRNGTL